MCLIFALKFQSGMFGVGLFKVEDESFSGTALATADRVEQREEEQNEKCPIFMRRIIQDIKNSIIYGFWNVEFMTLLEFL